MGLVALWHVGSPQTRARTHVPCIGRQILNQCATREVPRWYSFHPYFHIRWLRHSHSKYLDQGYQLINGWPTVQVTFIVYFTKIKSVKVFSNWKKSNIEEIWQIYKEINVHAIKRGRLTDLWNFSVLMHSGMWGVININSINVLSTYSFQFLHLKRIQISLFRTYLKTVLKYLHSWIRSIISQWMFFFIILRRTDVDLCLLSTESKGEKAFAFWAFYFVYFAWSPPIVASWIFPWEPQWQIFWRSGLCSTHLSPYSLRFFRHQRW